MDERILAGTEVEYIGGPASWTATVFDTGLGRKAVVVDPSKIPGAQLFMGKNDINLCIQWLDAPTDGSIRDRFACTSTKRVRVLGA